MSSFGDGEFTFDKINHFLQNYIQLDDQSKDKLLYQDTLKQINLQLFKHKESICDLLKWDTNFTKDRKFNSNVQIDGMSYKITEDQHTLALKWSHCLMLNYDYICRVLSLTEANLTTVLNQRIAILDIISTLIDIPDLNPDWNHWILNNPTTRLKLIDNLIDSIQSLVNNSREINKVSNVSLNEPESSLQLIHSKNMNDLIYFDKMLKLISNLILNSNEILDFHTILNWFKKLDSWFQFCQIDLVAVLPDIPYSTLLQLTSLININSLLFLGFDTSLNSFNVEKSSFFNDCKNFVQLQNIIDDKLSSNSLISYCWACILFYKSVLLETLDENNDTGSSQDKMFLSNYNNEYPNVSLNDMFTLFAQRAEHLNVFQDITNIAASLNNDPMYPIIMTSLVSFLINFIPLNIETTKMIQSVLLNTPSRFIEEFLSSDTFAKKFALLRAKLPLVEEGLIPFINMVTTLPDFANFELKMLTTYATRTKLNDIDYDLLDENNIAAIGDTSNSSSGSSNGAVISLHDSVSSNVSDLIIMKRETFVKPPFELEENVMMSIPKDTKGQLVQFSSTGKAVATSDNSLISKENSVTPKNAANKLNTDNSNRNSDLVIYSIKYSGWSLVGRILQNISTLYFNIGISLDAVTKDLMLSIIKLTSTIVDPSLIDYNRSQEILFSMSSQINSDNEDIVSVIFKIYEIALNKRDYNVLVECSKFTNLLTGYYPNLVWSYLIRSTLLEKYGKTGLISTILGTMELPNGKYDFTINLSILINLLVEHTFTRDNTTSERTKKELLQKFTIHFIHVFENCQFWEFNNLNDKFKLCLNLITFFHKVLYNVYGIDPTCTPKEKITGTLSQASETIVAFFLENQSTDSYTTKTLLSILTSYTGLEYATYGDPTFDEDYVDLIISSFKFTNLLISIRNFLKLSPSVLEQNIFNSISTLAQRYIENTSLRIPIIKLFTTLVSISWNDNYPFLLSYLGESTARDMFQSVSNDLKSFLNDFKLLENIYIFIGSLLQSKQDGLVVLFLTGDIMTKAYHNEKDVNEENTMDKSSDKSIIKILKGNVINMNKYPEYVSCALLDCISYALNSWIHSKNLTNDLKFIDVLLDKFNAFIPKKLQDMDQEGVRLMIEQYRSVSKIIEIFALYLFICPQKNSAVYKLLDDKNLYVKIKPYFDYTNDDKIVQEKLVAKFESTYPSSPLNKFRVAQFSSSINRFDDCIFNIKLMNKWFNGDERWNSTLKEPGLLQTVKSIESHIQYNHYKISAAKSWGALITSYVKINGAPNAHFIDIVIHFLEMNSQLESSKNNYSPLYHERVELVFYILYYYQKSGSDISTKKLLDMLKLLIVTFKSKEINYFENVASYLNKNEYQTVIRCVLIVLSLVKDSKKFVELASDQLLEFFECAFSKGIYLILHKILIDVSSPLKSQKEMTLLMIEEKVQDISLLIRLFIVIKSFNPPENFNKILASSLYESGTIQVILNLYSNAHLLQNVSQNISGSLALNIIYELCALPEIASQFIRNGLFVTLLESPLSVMIQKGTVRPEYDPVLHDIWSKGLLSIILLLLSIFGKRVLAETCVFLKYFDKQVQCSISSWTNSKLAISTALIRETSQLIMLQKMLDALNYQEYLRYNSDYSKQNENESLGLIYGLDEEYERSDLYDTLGNLLTHPKYLNSRIVAMSTEEKEKLSDPLLHEKLVNEINSDIKELQQSLVTKL